MARAFARGDDGTLRVTFGDGRADGFFTFPMLVRQKRLLTALREREIARLDGEIDEINEMLEQAQALGCTGRTPTGARAAAIAEIDQKDVVLPAPTIGKRIWGMLTKPRGIGQ